MLAIGGIVKIKILVQNIAINISNRLSRRLKYLFWKIFFSIKKLIFNDLSKGLDALNS